jgi:hypothetical protein
VPSSLDQFNIVSNSAQQLRSAIYRWVYHIPNTSVRFLPSKNVTVHANLVALATLQLDEGFYYTLDITSTLTLEIPAELCTVIEGEREIKGTNLITNLNHLFLLVVV